jgi:hypothetical protein
LSPVKELPGSTKPEDPESLDIRLIGAALCSLGKTKRYTGLPNTRVVSVYRKHLATCKTGLKEDHFKNLLHLLHGKSTADDKARFLACFQSFIKDHEDKIFLNIITEEDML